MTKEQVARVQTTWEMVVPIADTAADLFYKRLFELDGSLRTLFPDDITDQKRKLMTMISAAVRGLTNLEALVPVVEELGRRHVGYRVRDEHYDTVGAALLWTLGRGLGEEFTPETEAAWTETYAVLASVMKSAAAAV